MKFHTGPRFGLTEEEQTAIYGICTSYKRLSTETRQIIDNAIQSEGGIYATPLFDAVTTKEPVPSVAFRTNGTNYPIDPSQLAKRVGAVYKRLAKTLPVWNSPAETPHTYDTLTEQDSF